MRSQLLTVLFEVADDGQFLKCKVPENPTARYRKALDGVCLALNTLKHWTEVEDLPFVVSQHLRDQCLRIDGHAVFRLHRVEQNVVHPNIAASFQNPSKTLTATRGGFDRHEQDWGLCRAASIGGIPGRQAQTKVECVEPALLEVVQSAARNLLERGRRSQPIVGSHQVFESHAFIVSPHRLQKAGKRLWTSVREVQSACLEVAKIEKVVATRQVDQLSDPGRASGVNASAPFGAHRWRSGRLGCPESQCPSSRMVTSKDNRSGRVDVDSRELEERAGRLMPTGATPGEVESAASCAWRPADSRRYGVVPPSEDVA